MSTPQPSVGRSYIRTSVPAGLRTRSFVLAYPDPVARRADGERLLAHSSHIDFVFRCRLRRRIFLLKCKHGQARGTCPRPARTFGHRAKRPSRGGQCGSARLVHDGGSPGGSSAVHLPAIWWQLWRRNCRQLGRCLRNVRRCQRHRRTRHRHAGTSLVTLCIGTRVLGAIFRR